MLSVQHFGKLAAPRPWRSAKTVKTYKELSSSDEEDYQDVDSSFNNTVNEEDLTVQDYIHTRKVTGISDQLNNLNPFIADQPDIMPDNAGAAPVPGLRGKGARG